VESRAQAEINELGRQRARALLGWLNDQEAAQLLLGLNPTPKDDLRNIQTKVATYRMTVASRPPYRQENAVVTGLEEDRLMAVAARPEVQANFARLRWQPAMVDLERLLSFQKVVVIEGLEERLGSTPPSIDELFELCLPLHQPAPPASALTDPDAKGFTVSSLNPNLRLFPAQVGEAQVSPAPGQAPVPMQALTFLVYMGTSYLQVASYRERYFVRDGNHRVVGLLRLGIKTAPCVLIEARSFDEVAPLPGALSYEILFGDRPPRVADFWADDVAAEITGYAFRKVVRARGEEFVVPR